ncbi:hypothetical protein I3V78_02000 [Archangium primigenium]|nr:hypothetical protein [Archangium primigenium]
MNRVDAPEFPSMLHGTSAAILRKVRAEGRWWVREYRKTGAFPPPREMSQVSPGDVIVVRPGAEFDLNQSRWWVHLFVGVFTHMSEGTPPEEQQRTSETFESFCLGTPWGALYHAVSPPPLRTAERTAHRLTSVLRFWEELQTLRYAFRFGAKFTLEELMAEVYRETLNAWCPEAPGSLREHIALAAERMSHATREQSTEVLLQLIPGLVTGDRDLKHHAVLSDPDFLRERLVELPAEDFADIAGTYKYAVAVQLAAWDRELDRH